MKNLAFGRKDTMKERLTSKKTPPQTLPQIELSGVLGKAMQLGRIQQQCLMGKLTWAAFYTEREVLKRMRAEFEATFLKPGDQT